MRNDFLRHLAEATTPPASTPGETTVTVVFVDLAGFTPLTLTGGDQGVTEVLRAFSAAVRSATRAHAGRIVKQIGDAFMLVFDRPGDAIVFGLTVLGWAAADPDFPGLHIGAHHGSVLYREGDYFGNGVNLTARVAAAAQHNQFLITSATRDAASAIAAACFIDLPPRPMKGLTDPVPLVDVSATPASPT